jgi:hypothetical protein
LRATIAAASDARRADRGRDHADGRDRRKSRDLGSGWMVALGASARLSARICRPHSRLLPFVPNRHPQSRQEARRLGTRRATHHSRLFQVRGFRTPQTGQERARHYRTEHWQSIGGLLRQVGVQLVQPPTP